MSVYVNHEVKCLVCYLTILVLVFVGVLEVIPIRVSIKLKTEALVIYT